MLTFEIFSLDYNYPDWMITTRISLILHKAEVKPKRLVNIEDIPQVQVGFNWLVSHK